MALTPGTILSHFIDRSPWVDRQNTVDTVKYGDADKPVSRAAVCWYPALESLKQAVSLGCDVLFTHEPLWWDHWDRPLGWQRKEPGLQRLAVLNASGLTVVRLHDTWDNWPGIGIRDSFARGLGFTEFIGQDETRWHAVYSVPPQTLRSLAGHVARKVAPLGEDAVSVIGDPEKIVSRPSLGVGCGGPAEDMIALGSDVLIMCFDGASYWRDRQRLAEQGVGVITLEHGTTEMWGIESLAQYLRETFAGLDVHYLAGHQRAWHVRAQDGEQPGRPRT
ncbi:MAG: Nif3-like dinuclear metal center hexameric protein [Phycisphaerae bacterium]